MNNLDALHARAKALGLHGLLAHWHDATAATCTPAPIETTEMSTINRSKHHNLKGPKRALSYPNDPSPH
jgi:hypothetical protein